MSCSCSSRVHHVHVNDRSANRPNLRPFTQLIISGSTRSVFRLFLVIIGFVILASQATANPLKDKVQSLTARSSQPKENPLETLYTEAQAGHWPFVEGLAKGIAAPIGKQNNYSPYAEWYLGLAHHHRAQPEDAYMWFWQAYRNAKDKENKAELTLWCAQSALNSGMYAKAYAYQAGNTNAELSKWASTVRADLVRIATIDTLLGIRSLYPDDCIFAKMVVKRLLLPRNKAMYDQQAQQLISQYQFSDLGDAPAEAGEIQVVVLLPLGINKNDVRQTPRPNQPWLDLYEGLALANSHLADSGVKLNLHIYDVKKAFGWQDYLLTMNEFEGADLIIGPVIKQGSAEMAAYAQQHKILMLNPITNKVHWSKDNPYAWLAEPDANQVGTLLAAQAAQILPTKKVAIIYGPTPEDSTMAAGYKEVMEGLGAKIVLNHKVGKNSAANLPKFLLQSKIDSTGHIFAPNDEEIVKVQLPSSMSILKIKAPVLTYGEWLNAPNANLQMYERLKFYMVEPHLLSSINPAVTAFNKAYAKKTYIWPSTIAGQGYEALMYFGLNTGLRTIAPTDFSSASQTGVLGGCFNYSKGNANSCIPIYRIKDLILERVDR